MTRQIGYVLFRSTFLRLIAVTSDTAPILCHAVRGTGCGICGEACGWKFFMGSSAQKSTDSPTRLPTRCWGSLEE